MDCIDGSRSTDMAGPGASAGTGTSERYRSAQSAPPDVQNSTGPSTLRAPVALKMIPSTVVPQRRARQIAKSIFSEPPSSTPTGGD